MIALNDIAKFYLQDGKFLGGFDKPTIADASFACSLPHIAVFKDFELPAAIVAYKERFAKACPSWEKVRAPVDGYIASIHAKQAEAKGVDHGTLYVVYGTRASKVVWLAKTLGVDFNIKKVDLSKGENQTPEFLKKNPNGGIPTLELPDGQILFESGAILMYLLEKYDTTNSLTGPPGSKARNQFLVWNAFAAELEDCVVGYFQNTVLLGDKGNKALAQTNKENWEGFYQGLVEKVVAAAGTGNYINGANFSALDVVLGWVLNVASFSGLTKSSAPIEAYVAKLRQHPHFGPAHGK